MDTCRSLALVFCLSVTSTLYAQSDAKSGANPSVETAPPGDAASDASRASASAPEPISDAQIKDVREQLGKTTDGEQRFNLLQKLSRAYDRAGRGQESLKVRQEIVDDPAISPGRRSLYASDLALSEALLGEYRKGKALVAQAKDLAHQTGPAELESLAREPSYAFLSAEAEIARRGDNRHDVALLRYREHSDLAWSNLNDPSLSEKRRRAAANELLNDVTEMTRLLVQNNRRAEALSYANEISFYIKTRPDLQATQAQKARVDAARAIALCSFDDYDAALEAINASIAEFKRSGASEHDAIYGNALRLRLMIALSMGRLSEFMPDVEALGRGRATGTILAHSFESEEYDSLALAANGQWSAASDSIGVAMAANLRHQGSESPFYKYQAAMQMLFRLQDPQREVSYGEIERFVAPLASSDDNWADVSYRGSYTEDGALTMCLDRLMHSERFADPAQAQALAFRIAELLRINSSQGALADGAARLAAGNPKLRALIEQEQLLRYEQTTSQHSFAAAADRLDRLAKQNEAGSPVLKRQGDDVADKEKALQASSGKLTQLRREIAAQFPVYRELVAPSIPTPAKLGANLHPDEVYVNFYAGRAATYAFVVQSGGQLHAQRIDASRAQIKNLVVALRRSFDGGNPPGVPGELAGFDLGAAQTVFQTLVVPVQAWLKDASTVYLSTSGVLSSVPWDVLVTRPATRLADASWWISSVTPVEMPSASALILARLQNTKRAAMPFIAFADPSFDGKDHSPEGAGGVRSVRAAVVRGGNGTTSEIDYHLVTPLPETYDEVRAIATALSAPPQSIIRGTQATRSAALKDDLSEERIVEFATHGILPGEIPQMLKAGLAMAYEGNGLSDSVLTIDDVVGLRLNADWVVLSACNTGFASGDAGDSMSALSRGFFAAGARSVLATQWAVDSESAKQLTVAVFTLYAADPKLSKGDALVRAQRDMLGGKYGALYQHPYFWAPYFLAGDAAR